MRISIIAGLALWLVPSTALAQQTPVDVVSFLVTNQAVQTGAPQKDLAAAAATANTIVRSLLVNLAAQPIGTSSSGFAYRLDPELGTMTRVSDTFGTFFVERATTSGRGRASIGASATTAGYDKLDGLNLRDGSIITTANQFTDESAPFDTESLTLRINTSALTFFGSYGVTDRLEIGGAVPFVRLHLEGSRVEVYRGQTYTQASGSADASGIGDVALRAKYRLFSGHSAAFATAVEVRLPTGNDTDLLGAGATGYRALAIFSEEAGRVGVHGNGAIAWGGATGELTTGGALTFAASPRVTVTGEVLVNRLSDLREITSVSEPNPTIVGVETFRLVPGNTVPTVSSAVTGVKWNLKSTAVLSGEVLWRLGTGGLTAPATPMVSLDYLF